MITVGKTKERIAQEAAEREPVDDGSVNTFGLFLFCVIIGCVLIGGYLVMVPNLLYRVIGIAVVFAGGTAVPEFLEEFMGDDEYDAD